ncbi:formate/nitrite transporter family protein [Beijerinckia sp. L45]|uniref:formate/nitrite transporter family protein n=1 Tax=Beijerinckia sp. L45 TaxID=1641855 RepID=UPI00131B6C8B|nr:formate/nitrite transporter family protein [Beijerinckia sp. L45]
MIELGWAKTTMPVGQLLVRSGLAGALLGVATTLAFAATAQTGIPLVGALIFPVGFAMIVVLGLDLVTGSFALLPMAVMAGRATVRQMLVNWVLTFVGNFIGALILAVLMYVALTSAGHDAGGPIGDKIRAAVAARSAGYAAIGMDGLITVFVKAMLCNWLVCLGVTMAIAAPTVAGKVIGCWLPILTFFGQGFEHTVVNMSLFPLGLMMGAKATVGEYLLSNEIPVTIGNLVGGFLFTGLALFLAYQNREARVAPMPEARPVLS